MKTLALFIQNSNDYRAETVRAITPALVMVAYGILVYGGLNLLRLAGLF